MHTIRRSNIRLQHRQQVNVMTTPIGHEINTSQYMYKTMEGRTVTERVHGRFDRGDRRTLPCLLG